MVLIKYILNENSTNNVADVLNVVLTNRKIHNPQEYLNVSDKNEIPYKQLDNIDEAVECFDKHVTNRDKIEILVDEDVDGFTSAAIMYLYIKNFDSTYPVNYILHDRAKAHGLSDDVIGKIDCKLLIIPDAGSSDADQCKLLEERGVDVLILDHHEADAVNKNAIVVNNMLSNNYSNKDLSGVGVTYKFLKALDDYYMNDFSDTYSDLVALGLIGDMMDIRSLETKYLINKGLSNIQNKFFKELIVAQDYSMNGVVNIHNIQWYIVPIINAMIRVGSLEEKSLLFEAMIEDYKEFDYKKRCSNGSVKEDIYKRAAGICKNAKSRHDRSRDKIVNEILSESDLDRYDDKIIIIKSEKELDSSFTGLVAMKIADKFNKPCVILKRDSDNAYSGSARNCRNSYINNLKDFINELGMFEFAKGHQGAFGVGIKEENIGNAIKYANELLSGKEASKIYIVDFDISENELTINFISDVSKMDNYLGQGIEEVLIASHITLERSKVEVVGKNKNTISFTNNEGIKFILFNCYENSQLLCWANDDFGSDGFEIEMVGKPSVNNFQGVCTPQIVIVDYNVIGEVETVVADNEEDEVW